MKRNLMFSAIAIVILAAAGGLSQEKDPEMAKKMALSYELQKPGPEHKRLEALAGKWDLEVTVWPGPGAKPISFKGQCENRMILGGRFLLSESKSGLGPMTVETLSIIGFDRRHKKFTTVSFDSMGTYSVSAAGPFDEAKSAMIMYGEDVDPQLGTQKYDVVNRFIDPDKYVTEIIFKDPVHTKGKPEFKEVEITHTRMK